MQGTGLTPVGQERDRPHALSALGQDLQEKTPDALWHRQTHGLHLMALTAVAGGEADLAVTPLDEPVLGDGHPMRRASEMIQGLCRPGEGGLTSLVSSGHVKVPALSVVRAFMAQDMWVARMRQRQDAVALGYGQAFGVAVCHPRGLEQGLALGPVALAARVRGVTLAAPWRALFGVPAALGGAADRPIVHDLGRRPWPRRGGTIRRTREAEDVRDFPLGRAARRPSGGWVAAGAYRGHGHTPLEWAAGCRPAKDRRGYGGRHGVCG